HLRDQELIRLDRELRQVNELADSASRKAMDALAKTEHQSAALSDQLADANQLARFQAENDQRTIARLQGQIDELTALVQERDRQLVQMDTELRELNAAAQAQLAEKDSHLERSNRQVLELSATLQQRDLAIARLDGHLQELNASVQTQLA